MTTYYISDTHFDHVNIIGHCDRPFNSVDEMNEAMVQRWNTVVTPDDTVYHLGDFAWKRPEFWRKKLNGKIIFLQGNHDPKGFGVPYLEVKDGEYRLVLFHYPIVSWNGLFRSVFHFYGHVHNNPLRDMPVDWKARSFNVGAEYLDYTPRTADEIIMTGNR